MPHTKSALAALSPIDPHVPDTLRHAFASFATGVTVITALDEHGAPVGMTAMLITGGFFFASGIFPAHEGAKEKAIR